MQYEKRVETKEDYEAFLKFLIENSDDEYQKFHSKIVNSKKPVIGIRTPDLRALSKKLAKENLRAFLAVCGNDYYEEAVLRGMAIGYAKLDFSEFLAEFYRFLPYIENWAVCDFCLSNMKIVRKNKEAMFKEIEKLVLDEREFYARAGVVLLLWHYSDGGYTERIFSLFREIKNEKYYLQTAVAWCIAELYSKDGEKTLDFLKENPLDDFIYNKALQKITESNRVSKEEKQMIRNMKRTAK